MRLNKPINKSSPNRFLYILLLIHIIWIHTPFPFIFKHSALNIAAIIWYMVHVVHSLFIKFVYFTNYLFFNSLMEHLNFLRGWNFRELFLRYISFIFLLWCWIWGLSWCLVAVLVWICLEFSIGILLGYILALILLFRLSNYYWHMIWNIRLNRIILN
jgi:hypothetical protein